MTPRFMRHFSTLCITSFDDSTIQTIFSKIMEWHFTNSSMPSSLSAMSQTIVDASLTMYRIAMKGLLPTPLKSHYTFNVRDFAKVVQGVSNIQKRRERASRNGSTVAIVIVYYLT